MVDFFKALRDKRAIAMAKIKEEAGPTVIKPPQKDWFTRINKVLSDHPGELTEWETNFLYDIKTYIVGTIPYKSGNLDQLDLVLSSQVKNKITEIELELSKG